MRVYVVSDPTGETSQTRSSIGGVTPGAADIYQGDQEFVEVVLNGFYRQVILNEPVALGPEWAEALTAAGLEVDEVDPEEGE